MDTTYQLNPLVNAQKNFSVMETRLFYLGLRAINPHITANDKYFDENFPDTIISPSELKKIFGHGQYLAEIKKACKRLIGSSIEINYEEGFDLYSIFQHIKYKENQGVYIKFSEEMRPFILDIYNGYKKYGFTRVEMQQIFVLDSAYAMRLLELLLQYNGKKKNGIITRKISIDELRRRLSVPPNTYKRMKDLRRIVLDLPINEIERKTRYAITYRTIKEGRNVVAIEFQCDCSNIIEDNDFTATIEAEDITNKEKDKAPLKAIEKEHENIAELERRGQTRLFEETQKPKPQNEEELEHLGRLGKYEIAPQTGRRLIKKYGWERIDANLKYAYEHRQRKENMSGWVIDCIKNDRAAGAAEAKRLAKKAADKKQKELLARLEPLPFEIEPPRELPADSPFKRFERKPHIKRAASKK